MTIWQLHLLNARSALTPIMAEIRAHAREVVALVEARLSLPRFDLVVRAGDEVIPDWGIASRTPVPGIIELTLDPARVAPEHFRRTLAHEMHHLARWDGPGYGRSLGEVMVSEGLAGHFVLELMGDPADPWDMVRPGSGTLKQAAALWARRDYDHGEWFQGRGKMRKWTGYGIGHRVVAAHLADAEGESAASLVDAPADDFRTSLRRLMASEGVEAPDEDLDLLPATVDADDEAAAAAEADAEVVGDAPLASPDDRGASPSAAPGDPDIKAGEA